jgi:hypothetical protein
MAERFHYKKLPGHRQGFLRGASVWLGADHLLLVRSLRFREEYKRYYFRDIQAIVIAKAPRFHISTRMAVLAALCLPPFLTARTGTLFSMWRAAAVLLVLVWVLVSALRSCRCQIYTAVSADELPSLYRMWTAHRFLVRVQPLIQQAQSALGATPAQAVASPVIGPTEPLLPPPVSPPPRDYTRTALAVFAVLTASLFADAIWNVLTLHSTAGWSQAVNAGLTLVETGTAIAVIVHHYRGQARGAMQKLAIATLVAMGIFFYGQTIAASVTAAVEASASGQRPMLSLIFNSSIREIEAVLAAVLGIVGVVIMLAKPADTKGGIIYPST